MKVLLIDVNYGNSSTGKIVSGIFEQLQVKGEEAYIIFGRGEKVSKPNIERVAGKIEVYFHALAARIIGINGYFSPLATAKTIKIIKQFKPDIVHLHDIHGYFINIYALIKYLKREKIKTVWTFHCEFMYTGKCAHSYECENWKTICRKCPHLRDYPKSYFLDFTRSMQKWKKKNLRNWNHLTIVSPSIWLENRIRQSFLRGERLLTIHNGVNTEQIFRRMDASVLYNKHSVNGRKVVLTAASNMMDRNKGGKQFIALAESLIDQDILFIMIGVNKGIDNLPPNIIPISRINDQRLLAQYYSLADLFVICSERENFPTVCLEALCCGTPICGYDVGGIAETAPNGLGKFVKYGDIRELKMAVIDMLNVENIKERCEVFGKEEYSEEAMFEKYYSLYRSLLKN
jgi:glycosyltransferase involved in cell wall biosynthesis